MKIIIVIFVFLTINSPAQAVDIPFSKLARSISEYIDDIAQYADETAQYIDEAAQYIDEAAQYGDEAAQYIDEAAQYGDETAQYIDDISALAYNDPPDDLLIKALEEGEKKIAEKVARKAAKEAAILARRIEEIKQNSRLQRMVDGYFQDFYSDVNEKGEVIRSSMDKFLSAVGRD